MNKEKVLHKQVSQFSSPWSFTFRIKMLLWELCWAIFCSWTPKPANCWRLFWLRLFGAKIFGRPFVHQRARIQIPWNLTMHDKSCLGDRTNAYSLGRIEIMEHAIVAQEVYLCAGTHSFDLPEKILVTNSIIIESNVFIGARAFILPGITIGENSIIGACSVVTKNVVPNTTIKGNPAN
jgi:putative colanic acid biosynthesis acetyltransferase WcaF